MKARYKTVRTDTELGLLKAELLKKNGWKVESVGFSTIQFSKMCQPPLPPEIVCVEGYVAADNEYISGYYNDNEGNDIRCRD